MHFAIVPIDSPLRIEIASLVDLGRIQWIERFEDAAQPGADDHVLLSASCVDRWLTFLTERCRAGHLGSIHILIDADIPAWEPIGFRVRPWVKAIHRIGSASFATPPGCVPAPIRHSASVADVLVTCSEPAFRPDELPTPFPPKIQIETTAHCGLNCPYCPKSIQAPDRTRMEEDLFCKILDECRTGRPDSIELYLSGDPLTDPRLEHLADLAKEASPDSLIEIITHERSINERRSHRLAASGLDAVFVSVNFPEPTPSEEIRRRIERVAGFRKIFLAAGKQLVIVTLTNLFDAETRSHFDSITGELGVPYERFRATNRLGDVDLTQFAAAATAPPPTPKVCERPFTKAYIRANGNVLLCCEDWNDRWVMGNVKTTSLAEIWSNSLYRTRRRELLSGKPSAPCDNCLYAGTAQKREASRSNLPEETGEWRGTV